ncbi:MAG: hypothetical protein JNK48_24615 [Bryobacterales bacterium]|nr:hypothetical protein [Bryobacterales bacterium]
MMWQAIVVGCVFVWLFMRKGAWAALVASFSWFGYGLWEYGMKTRILCSGECNIRVDLLFIYPLLIVISGWALVQCAVSIDRGRGGR